MTSWTTKSLSTSNMPLQFCLSTGIKFHFWSVTPHWSLGLEKVRKTLPHGPWEDGTSLETSLYLNRSKSLTGLSRVQTHTSWGSTSQPTSTCLCISQFFNCLILSTLSFSIPVVILVFSCHNIRPVIYLTTSQVSAFNNYQGRVETNTKEKRPGDWTEQYGKCKHSNPRDSEG